MYTVVVCSECKFVWIIEDRPDTSLCRRCHKRRKFKSLKKYYQTDDSEAAKLARAHTQAKVNNQESRFEEELENGALEVEIDAVVSESEYLAEKGLDAQAVSREVEDMLHENSIPSSKPEIVESALSSQETPTLEDFLRITNEYGLTEEESLDQLKKLHRSNGEAELGEIKVGEIDEALDNATSNKGETQKQSHSARDIIYIGLSELDAPTEQGIIEFAVEEGVDKGKVDTYLSKLIEAGEITRGKNGSLRAIE